MNNVLLEVRRLKKYFPLTKGVLLRRTAGWLRAVDDVSLAIKSGETLALVGESGCGKTTTARLILRLEEVTDGTIHFEGRDITSLGRSELGHFRRSVQAVFQDPWSSMNPRQRVEKFISEPVVVHRSLEGATLRARVRELLSLVGLRAEHARLFPHQFSGGQRQRIAVARALSVDPKLIVLDEPVSALDVSIRAQILNLLKDLQAKNGMSYLLIAHDLGSVRFMAHSIAVMYLGRVVETGPIKDVTSDPLHPYSRALYVAAATDSASIEKGRSIVLGEPPSPLAVPSGCRFRTRCPHAMPVCADVDPDLREIGPSRWVACHLY